MDFQLAFMSEVLPVMQAGIPAGSAAVVTGVMPGAVSQAVAPKMPASMFASLVEELFSAPVVAVAPPKIPVQTLPARPRTERRDEVPVKIEKLKGELVVFAAVIPYVVIPEPMQIKVGLRADAPKVRAEVAVAAPEAEAPLVMLPHPAVQLKIREQTVAAENVAEAPRTELPVRAAAQGVVASDPPSDPHRRKQQPVPAVPVVAVAPAVQVQISTMPEDAPAKPREAPFVQASVPMEAEVVEQPKSATPLRSVSIDFKGDGVENIRLRFSEKSGEVHVSLHSADASLSGRLNAGVGELVQSLSAAGYDAQPYDSRAFSPDGGREQQRQRRFYEYSKPSNSRLGGTAFATEFGSDQPE